MINEEKALHQIYLIHNESIERKCFKIDLICFRLTRTPTIHPNFTTSTFGFVSTCDVKSVCGTNILTISLFKSIVDPNRNFDVSCNASSVGRLFDSGDVIENKFL